MKTLYLSLIPIMIFFLFANLGQAHADNDAYVQNIMAQPSAVKLGDSFTVTTTLVNNSTGPIWVVGGKCSAADTEAEFLTVTFDNHAKIKEKNIFCAGVGWYQKLDPKQNLTTTVPDYTAIFIATESGIANGKIRFLYHIFNQTDPTQPGYDGNISQPFQFTISDQSGFRSGNVYGPGGPAVTITLDPLQQYKSGIDPYKTKCENNLVLVISSNNTPACVKQTSLNRLWFGGWINKSPSIYMKYLDPSIAEKFQSKIIGREQAINIVQDYIKQNNLKLNVNMRSNTFKIVTSLNYELVSSAYSYLLDVDPNTGLPTTVMSPWWTDYYTNPQWWSELEKSYLGMKNNRIEDGALVWHVDYRDCPNCIAPYPMFMVDAVTGKILLVPNTGFIH